MRYRYKTSKKDQFYPLSLCESNLTSDIWRYIYRQIQREAIKYDFDSAGPDVRPNFSLKFSIQSGEENEKSKWVDWEGQGRRRGGYEW